MTLRVLLSLFPTWKKSFGITITKQQSYIMGASRGELQLFLALTHFPHLQSYFHKAFSLSGLVDMERCIRQRPDMLAMFKEDFGYDDTPEWLQKRNPVARADKIFPHFPCSYCKVQRITVSVSVRGMRCFKALKSRECPVDYIEIAEGNHCL